MLRLTEVSGVIHSGNWICGEWIGRTACGYEFVTPKNQRQQVTATGQLIAKRSMRCAWGPGVMFILEALEALEVLESVQDTHSISCMTCMVREPV